MTPDRVQAMLDRLGENKAVRRTLPLYGRVHIDRLLPFLCVYRKPIARPDPGTDRLCVAEAAYVLASGAREFRGPLSHLVRSVADLMVERFGSFLVLELWTAETVPEPLDEAPPRTGFTIYRQPGNGMAKSLDVLEERLRSIKTLKQGATVHQRVSKRCCPHDLPPLITYRESEALGIHVLGLEVEPTYVNAETGEVYPLLLRSLRRQLGHVLDRLFYEFAHERTTHQPAHYHALGRRAMVKAVWEVDRRLAAVSSSFDFLYQVTPLNAEPAWHEFKRRRCDILPSFLYRPRTVDPGRMKRALYDIPIDRVEDPTLAHLFLAKQRELDRQLSMLLDLGSKAFLYGSLQLYGAVPRSLRRTAHDLLATTSPRSRTDARDGYLDAAQFASLARSEVRWYQRHWPEFSARVRVAQDMYSGLLVSRGRLLVGKGARIPRRRANALIQHEVGTHLLTYYNGRSQPFKMLYTGLPGYEELQEGLAVLAEYLVGGLSVARLRVLAARVVAAHAMAVGSSFVDVFRMLDVEYGFAQRTAFTIAMRVFRGGGLVKDAIYLRGLVGMLRYLRDGGGLERLLIGKIGAQHVGIIEELLHRRILNPTPAAPRYLSLPEAQRRLDQVRKGLTVMDMTKRQRRIA